MKMVENLTQFDIIEFNEPFILRCGSEGSPLLSYEKFSKVRYRDDIYLVSLEDGQIYSPAEWLR